MIKLTKLNGKKFYLNVFQIKTMKAIPETKIKMMDNDYYLVKETIEEVQKKIEDFWRLRLGDEQ